MSVSTLTRMFSQSIRLSRKNICHAKETCGPKYGTLPPLTKDRYPHVKRGNFNKVTDEHIKFFKEFLGSRIITSENDTEAFNIDWLRMVRGQSRVVLKPKTTEEVSTILNYCNKNRLAVCPQGGNTGLVGGSVPVYDEIVLSMNLMNKILLMDVFSGVIICQSGCILSQLDKQLRENNLMMPLDLGAKDSCQIGGNLSTNAGGIRLIKYGSLHGNVLGVEAVLADGRVLDMLSALKKDNTGYHLHHLFIGSEGTLGVITKAAIKCPSAPMAVNIAFLGLSSFENVLKTFQLGRSVLGEIMSSCELIDKMSLDYSLRFCKINHPLPNEYDFYMLIETNGNDGEHDQDKLKRFLNAVMEKELILDGIMAHSLTQVQSIWRLRESIPVALHDLGNVFKYDISIPLNNFYEPVGIMKERLQGFSGINVCGYGHMGDGNLHLNVTSEKYDQELADQIEPFIFEWTQKLRGSVSAEHGIGFKKTQFLHFSKTEECIRVMKDLKRLFDPNGILNPYKVLPLD